MLDIVYTRKSRKASGKYNLDELIAVPRLKTGKSLIKPPKPYQAEFVGIGRIASSKLVSIAKYAFYKILS